MDHISFSVPKQSIFVYLGENGSGKSTTIRMLTTVLKPDGGRVLYGDLELGRDNASIRKIIASIPQFNAIHSTLTVHENIYTYYRMRLYSHEEAIRTTDQVIVSYGLESYRNSKVGTLSGGYKRRVEVGRALETNAPIIFLDEPTTGLDPASKRLVWEKLKQAKHAGKTIFLTTQLMEEAEALADYVTFIKAGQILDSKPIDQLKEVFSNHNVVVEFCSTIDESLLPYPISHKEGYRYILAPGEKIPPEEVLHHLSQQGLPIHSFAPHQSTMEDIYFHIMGGQYHG
ncbi:MAG: ABC transporter ATP-binding protein [Tissierellia bacterium]|nr:ABC transporter ATP-binding protein [Tissierellia bacterium]